MSVAVRPRILVVDDDPLARELTRDTLAVLDCDIVEAADGVDGIVAARRREPDLVLLDVRMPGIDGWTVCRRLKELPGGRFVPVVIISGDNDSDSRVTSIKAGADGVMAKPYAGAELVERVRSLLDARVFYQTLDGVDSFLASLSLALDAKSIHSRRHSQRVAELARALAAATGLEGSPLEDLFRAALVHDIGKIGVPDAILSKTDCLEDVEVEQMRQHVLTGAKLVAPLAMAATLTPVIRHHHERWDGTGYPDRLAGPEIPFYARIVAICDAWDAMTHDRPYRKALGAGVAAARLAAGSGSQWDPVLVPLFLEAVIGCTGWVPATVVSRN